MLLTRTVVLITGAGRGIGRAIALAFAGEGARTIVTGRNTHLLTQVVDEIRASGGAAEAFALDVTRSDDAGRVARQVIRTWGQIDALVNNAGVITYDTPVWATTIDQWDEVMNTNLRGMFLVYRAVIPHMMQRKKGVIVNIGRHPAVCLRAITELMQRQNGAWWAIPPRWPTPGVPTAFGSTASIPTGWIPTWPGRMISRETPIG